MGNCAKSDNWLYLKEKLTAFLHHILGSECLTYNNSKKANSTFLENIFGELRAMLCNYLALVISIMSLEAESYRFVPMITILSAD